MIADRRVCFAFQRPVRSMVRVGGRFKMA